ncbi:MAG: DsrE family protein [Ardenticatenaceae bacterium]|nr:DsrE family protein [Ardenticatenaceae bacterium]HBY95204.1 hypothetical protein [Chloroflexota bacterium]
MAKILYVATHGSEDPSRAAMPFHLANGAVEAGIDAEIALAGDAAFLMKGYVVDSIIPVGMPALKELFSQAVQNQIPIYV